MNGPLFFIGTSPRYTYYSNCILISINVIVYCCIVLLALFTISIDLSTSLKVSFHQSSYSVNEGDQLLQPQLILNELSSTNITVLIRSIDITATCEYIIINTIFTCYLITGGGADYNSVLYNATFPAGATDVSFDVTIINDTVLENNETFSLTIIGDSLPENVTLGKITQATVTIVNDGGSCKYAID